MNEQSSPVLEISSLSAGYGRFDVVRDIGLSVGKGEAVALLGPNGAGKTTVLRAIMGLVKQRRGLIRIGETDVSALPTHRIARGLAAVIAAGRHFELRIDARPVRPGVHDALAPAREAVDALADCIGGERGERRGG